MAIYLFLLLALLSVGSILGMIVFKNQAYAALFIVLLFVCTGGLFAMLDAPFIAAIQIIIYAGAIMVLFIFVIMMVDVRKGLSPERKKWTISLSVLIAAVLGLEIYLASKGLFSNLGSTGGETIGDPKKIGHLLFSDYLYAFEITSVLIVAALVGAIVLMKKKDEK
jgi:NADH-quinone oxidoreductase subunit J